MTSGGAEAPYSMQETITTPAMPTPPTSASHSPPSNDDIEKVIQMATAAAGNDNRTLPLRDTRTQLFVANLPYRVRWQDLKDLFRKSGTVLRADVSLGPDNRSRGYGTVLLATAEDAGRAVDMFNGYEWQHRTLDVRADRMRDFDQPFPEFEEDVGPIGKTLFVGNLPFHVQWQDLKDLFRQAGTIVRADVALGPDGRSRGFGTVLFATEKDARKAVSMFSGYDLNGRPLKVHYDKFAQNGATQQHPFDLGHLASSPFDLSYKSEPYHGDLFGQFPVPAPAVHPNAFDTGGLGSPISMALHTQMQQLHLDSRTPIPHKPPPPLVDPSLAVKQGLPTSGAAPNPAAPPPLSPGSSPTSSKRASASPHPHHPGPIALPPPALPPGGANPGFGLLTPLGLPPITPSMPPFSFLPMPSPGISPGQPYLGMGPPTAAHFMNGTPLTTPTSPMFPMYAMSPGAFWGRPGEGAVYAAPVGQPPAPYGPFAGSPGVFGMHPMGPPPPVGPTPVMAMEPSGYFDFLPTVEKEIMKEPAIAKPGDGAENSVCKPADPSPDNTQTLSPGKPPPPPSD